MLRFLKISLNYEWINQKVFIITYLSTLTVIGITTHRYKNTLLLEDTFLIILFFLTLFQLLYLALSLRHDYKNLRRIRQLRISFNQLVLIKFFIGYILCFLTTITFSSIFLQECSIYVFNLFSIPITLLYVLLLIIHSTFYHYKNKDTSIKWGRLILAVISTIYTVIVTFIHFYLTILAMAWDLSTLEFLQYYLTSPIFWFIVIIFVCYQVLFIQLNRKGIEV